MSVLIKGMEMPECCGKCWAINVYGDYPICLITGETRGYNFRIRERRMDKCPLVEVPTPHGRLIDADALKEVIAATYFSQDEKDKAPMDDIPWMNGCNTKVKEVCWMIDDAPTVMEAEEGEG